MERDLYGRELNYNKEKICDTCGGGPASDEMMILENSEIAVKWGQPYVRVSWWIKLGL